MSKVTVLIATYNGEKYISNQLDSILNQTFKDIKILIHDDGSKDNTNIILADYATRYPEIIKILDYPSTGGACKNFMSLLQYSESEYTMFSDQDDFWLPEKIETLVDDIKKAEDNKPCLVFCNLKVVDNDLNVIDDDFMRFSGYNVNDIGLERLLIENVAPGCAMIINRKLLDIVKQYSNPDNIYMHDWWCMVIARITGNIVFEPKSFNLYRQHSNNVYGAKQRLGLAVRIKNNIIRLFNGSIQKEMKYMYSCVFKQAKELNNTLKKIGVEDKKTAVLAQLDELSTFKRKIVFLKEGFGRKKRKLWFSFWV